MGFKSSCDRDQYKICKMFKLLRIKLGRNDYESRAITFRGSDQEDMIKKLAVDLIHNVLQEI